jgi:hypothetical protein
VSDNEFQPPSDQAPPAEEKQETPVPTEFVQFLRRTGIGAFDRFAQRLASTGDDESSTPLQKLAVTWRGMSKSEKERFLDQILASGAVLVAAAPAAIAGIRAVRKRAARRKPAAAKAPGARTAAKKKAPPKAKAVKPVQETPKKKKKTPEEKAEKKARKAEKKLAKEARKAEKRAKKEAKKKAEAQASNSAPRPV